MELKQLILEINKFLTGFTVQRVANFFKLKTAKTLEK
jgi:hypothetical protein